ncbi:hypothetical protein BDR04DRAFT_1101871 [Suillus decipiens]|nr:hypothetical protein BDR04DRAFT_1101871 [Suillus decipiens]
MDFLSVAGPKRARCYYPKWHPRVSNTPLPAASRHVIMQCTLQSVTEDRCMVTAKDMALGPSDMVITTDDTSETVPPITLKQFDWEECNCACA